MEQEVIFDLNKYMNILSMESYDPREYVLNSEVYSTEAKKDKPKAKDVYDAAEEIKKLEKQLKEEREKKNPNKEKIAKLESEIKKLQNQKNNMKKQRKQGEK